MTIKRNEICDLFSELTSLAWNNVVKEPTLQKPSSTQSTEGLVPDLAMRYVTYFVNYPPYPGTMLLRSRPSKNPPLLNLQEALLPILLSEVYGNTCATMFDFRIVDTGSHSYSNKPPQSVLITAKK